MSNCTSSGREEEDHERMEVALFEDAAFWEELQPWETACETKQVRIRKFVEAILRRDTSSVDSCESSYRTARGPARASSASTARYLDYCQLDEACGPCGAAGAGGGVEDADFSADQRRKARLLQAKLFRPRQLFVGENNNKEEDEAQLLLGESLPCLWAGTAGSSSRLHYDTTGTNYILQLHGRKRWLLFPPNAPAPAAEVGTSRVEVLMPETRLPFEETTVFSHGAVGDSLAEYVESYRLIDRERRRLSKKIPQLDEEDVKGDDPRFQGVPGGGRAGIAGGKATKTKTKSPQLRSTSWERASCSAQEQQQQQRQHEDDTSTSGVIDEEDHVDEDVTMEDCEQQDPPEQRPLAAAPPSEASLLLEMQLQRPLTVLLNPGDLLFLPRHWWHATIAVDKACLALNQWVPHSLDSHAKKTESLCRCLVGALATRYAEHLEQGGAAGGAGAVLARDEILALVKRDRRNKQKIFCHEELADLVGRCHVIICMLLSDEPTLAAVTQICDVWDEKGRSHMIEMSLKEASKPHAGAEEEEGEEGNKQGKLANLLLVNCATLSPSTVQLLNDRAGGSKDVQFVNCSVTGRPEHATKRMLCAWIASEDPDAAQQVAHSITPPFARLRLDCTASAKYKICTNFLVYGMGELLGECLCLLDAAGVERDRLLDFTQGGVLPGLIADVYAKKMVHREFRRKPIGADLQVAKKDLALMKRLQLGLETGGAVPLPPGSGGRTSSTKPALPILDTVLAHVEAQMAAVKLAAEKEGEQGTPETEWWASYHVLSRTPEPLRFSTFWEGFPETLRYLGRVFREQGPFDGLLGFSQGGMVVHHLVNFVGARYGGDFERAADAYEAGFSERVRADLIANAGDVLPHIKGVTYDGLAGDAADRKIAALPAGPVQNWGPLSTVRFVVSLSSAVPHDSSFPTAGRLQARRPRFPELSCLSIFHEADTVVRPEKSRMGLEGNYGDVLLVEESRRSSSTGPGGSDFSEEDDRQKMNAHRVPRWEELSEENQEKLITFVEQMQQKVALYDALLGPAADDAKRPDFNKRIGGQEPAFLAKQVDVATGTAPDVLDGSTRRSKL
eukprot:g12003.t1